MTWRSGARVGSLEVLSPIGGGGMGEVYRAKDLKLGRTVAVKVLRRDLARDTDRLARFEREARSASALNHPNIITIYDIGQDEGAPYLVMELVEGHTLRELLDEAPLPTGQIVTLGMQIADGLTEAHQAGIVHRDLKPENVMVTRDRGLVKILDFGLAKLTIPEMQEGAGAQAPASSSGIIIGTVGYMAPEQAASRPVDFRCDQFALGAILYETATGKRAFWKKTAVQTLSAIIEDDPPPLAEINPELPDALARIIEKLLEKEPSERYASTLDLLLALQELQGSDVLRLPGATPRVHRVSASEGESCPACGRMNRPGSHFCGKCGRPLSLSCPGCGQENPRRNRFCRACGRALPPREDVSGSSPTIRVPAASERKSSSGRLRDGERRHVTLLCGILDGYDTLIETLSSESADGALERIRASAAEVLGEHGGILNECEDGKLVAVFGVPATHEDDFLRAGRAALVLCEHVAALGAELGVSLRLRSGVHAGSVVARPGESASPYRLAGATLQLAEQLSRQAEPGETLVSRETGRLLAPFFELDETAPVPVKIGERMTSAFRLLRSSGVRSRLEASERLGLTRHEGRAEELALLERAAAKALGGEGQAVAIVGEAGVGKSRILYELTRRLGRDEARVAHGSSEPRGSNTPYFPFIEALKNVLELEDGASAEDVIARIRRIDPALDDYLPLYLSLLSLHSEAHPVPADLKGEHFRVSMLEALAALFIASTEDKALILMLEDWHWADEVSQSVLRQLAQMASSHRLSLLVTLRPEGSLAWAQGTSHTLIRLESLPLSGSMGIVRSLLGVEEIPVELGERIHARSGGNPFFTEELCRALVEEGALQVEAGAVSVVGSMASLHLPATVQAVIRTRLDRLDEDSRELLRCASVIGRDFGRRLLERVAPDAAEVVGTLESLKALGLLQQTRVLPEATYRFAHALIREVAYESLLHHQRKSLHGAVAHAMEALYADRLEEHLEALAHHYYEAEDWEQAFRFGREAARRASALGQFAEASRLMEKARSWLERLSDDSGRRRTRLEVLLEQERLFETLGEHEAQQRALDELLSYLEPEGDGPELADVYVRQAELHTLLGRFQEADSVLKRARELSRRLADAARERNSVRATSFLRWNQGRSEDAFELNEEALALVRRTGDRRAMAVDLTNQGAVLRGLGRHQEALAYLDRALDLHRELGRSLKQIETLHIKGVVYRDMGDDALALEFFEKAGALARQIRSPVHIVFQDAAIGNIHLERGQSEEGLRLFEEAVRIARRGSYAQGLSHSLRCLGDALYALERDEEALPHLEEAAELFEKLADRESEAWAREKVASIRERQEHPGAHAAWNKVLTLSRRLDRPGLALEAEEGLARLARRGGDVRDAATHYRRARELAREAGNRAREGDLLNSLGICEFQQKHYDRALAYYEEALSRFRALHDRVHEGFMLNSIGVVLRELGRYEDSVECLERALGVHRETGQKLLEGHARAALGATYLCMERHDDARRQYEASLRLRREIGDRGGEGWMLYRLAEIERAAGNPTRLRELLTEAAAVASELSDAILAKAVKELEG